MKRLTFLIISLSLLVPLGTLAESPQYGAFELKFGPYLPNIDEESSLNGAPYADTFGKNNNMFLTTLELDWQFLQTSWCTLGLGGSIGFMQAYAKSTTSSEYEGESGESSEDSDETSDSSDTADYTVLTVMPTALMAVWRIDGLANHTVIPIVPYFKAGLNWYLWVTVNGGKKTGSGGTLGYQFAPGIMIRLDNLDKRTARTFDNEVGVNHSYIFAEMLFATVDGFGRDGYMHLSTNNFANATMLFGIAIEF